jgi:hypothetical protein
MKLAGIALPRAWGSLVLAVGIAWSGEAWAQGAANRAALAQGLYDSAAELIKAGKFAEACPKLEESQRLDPAMGTQFFLAGCYEKTGRPTSAWALFLEVAAAARAAGNGVRETTARARAAALEPRLPRLRVILDDATRALPGLRVIRDGVPLAAVAHGAPIPVDLGEHVVRVQARGKAAWETRVTVREPAQKVDVRIPPLIDAPPEAPAAPSPASLAEPAGPAPDAGPAAPGGLGGQRIAAVVIGAVGLGGIAAGSALGLMAKSAWSDATTACPTLMACTAAAHDKSTQTLSLATGSTVAFVAGGAAVAAALVVWFTAPSRSPTAQLRVVPVAGPGAAGAFVTGGF